MIDKEKQKHNSRESYVKELLLLQKLIRFRRHELYSEDEASVLVELLNDIETVLEICADIRKEKEEE